MIAQRYSLTADTEAERLELQARVWEPGAEAMLDNIGVQSGWNCLDLGCGPGGIIAPLSRRVGPTGRVVGLDLDDELLARAQALSHGEGLSNVALIKGDAFDTKLPRGSFDLVHARFLFAPLGNWSALLNEMIALTRPGGVIAIEERDQSSWNYYPPLRTWPWLKGIAESAFLGRGHDVNVGRQLYGMVRQVGFEGVKVEAVTTALQGCHPYMRLPIDGVARGRDLILKAGLATQEALDEALDEIAKAVNDPDTFAVMFSLIQVWGRKPQ